MNTNTALQIFKYQGNEVRTVILNGEIYFVVADACKVLEINNVSMAVGRLDQDGVSQAEVIDSLGRKQTAAIANEPNLYRLIFRSDKSEAKAFQDWVYKEVLPSIRKTGSYSVAQNETYHVQLMGLTEQLDNLPMYFPSLTDTDEAWIVTNHMQRMLSQFRELMESASKARRIDHADVSELTRVLRVLDAHTVKLAANIDQELATDDTLTRILFEYREALLALAPDTHRWLPEGQTESILQIERASPEAE